MYRISRSLCAAHCSLSRLQLSAFQLPSTQVFVPSRGFASGDKKKGKKQAAQPAEETKKSDSLIPINIFADGKDPEVLPDDQYPDWLWHMLDPKVSPDEWETRHFEGATEKEMTDIIRIKAARKIKEYNLSKGK
ncbi:hypothetical protein WA538_002531 [Blastocystis sp. DL]